jgi:hypothetical protein
MSPFGIDVKPSCWAGGPCPRCDGDGYLEEWNEDQSGVVTELCPYCNATGDAAYVKCPGMGIDDLCAQAHGLNPFTDGCGLCMLGSSV